MKKIILLASCLFFTGIIANAQAINENAVANKGIAKSKNSSAMSLNPGSYPENKNILTSKSLAYSADQPDYLKKSKNQKIAAWSLLGAGVVCTGVGLLIIPKNYDLLDSNSGQDSQLAIGSVMSILGFASMITSIPFFVSSGIYKRRATVGVINQKTGFGAPPNVSSEIAGITMTISIGK